MKIKWSPELYSLYSEHRIRPNIDLFQYFPSTKKILNILDLGCGDAMYSTKLIHELSPISKITALDSSEIMLTEAKKNLKSKNIQWIKEDIEIYAPNKTYDLIIMCSTLQWIPNHESIIKHYFNYLNPNGRILIQMPNMFRTPFYTGILKTAKKLGFIDLISLLRKDPVLKDYEYDSIISQLSTKYSIWKTTYLQKLFGENSLLEWSKGAPLRPVIQYLSSFDLDMFYKNYNNILKKNYFNSTEYSILPFERIFLVFEKSI